jgi:hypothetical protein
MFLLPDGLFTTLLLRPIEPISERESKLPEILVGRMQVTSPKNICKQCSNAYWVISQTDDDQLWWMCPKCGARWPCKTRRGNQFPAGMKHFEPIPAVAGRH